MTSHIDNTMLSEIWRSLGSKTVRSTLKVIGVNGAVLFTEIKKYIEKQNNTKPSTGLAAYHVRRLVITGMLKKNENTRRYFLTRIGVEALSLVNAFDEICTKFDLDDCDADGRIETIVVERKNEELLPDEDKIKCLVCPHTAKSVKSIRIHHKMKHGRMR